jgi:indolepyruvate ferredoxin oxidoreductase alpha subunit
LNKRYQAGPKKPLWADPDKCIGCKVCLSLGCPPISWKKFENMPEKEIRRNAKKQEGHSVIDQTLCNGCTLCLQLCKTGAIREEA